MTGTAKQLLIGAHMPILGGVHKALLRGQEIGASTIQIFTANQRQWAKRTIPLQEIAQWQETFQASDLHKIMSHSSYLINLGSNKREVLTKSLKAFGEEIERSISLGLTYLNFHPGAATGDSVENCLNRIITSLLEMQPLLEKGSLRLLIETTAGQGSVVGNKFEHLAYIIQAVEHKIPIGVCIDTCHIFAAGYDIRNEHTWNRTLSEFEKIVGLDYLYAMHINDSKYPLGSHKDRHASLGKGEIGEQSFRILMQNPQLRNCPKYLETPDETLWENEIKILRNYAA